MKDFKTIHNRKATLSIKWDSLSKVFGTDDLLPMWIADMDFKAPQIVNETLQKRVEHGFYGYTMVSDSITQKVADWVSLEHDFLTSPTNFSFSPGVIPSINSTIQAFTKPGDKILIQTPVYTPFFHLIKSNNRKIVEQELINNGSKYTIDFNDFEEKLKNGVKAFVLCSPHNPVGRVWTRAELTKIAELCIRYDVLIFSDEIHADLVLGSNKHIPIASLSDAISQQTITFMSPTKTFNLAGLQVSYIITENKTFKKIIDNELTRQGINMINTFGVLALDAVYPEAKPWLTDLLKIIEQNKDYVISRLESETDLLTVTHAEGTYLLWINCEKLNLSPLELKKFFINQAKVGLNSGSTYGNAGNQFMRMNIACPIDIIEEATHRIIHAVNKK